MTMEEASGSSSWSREQEKAFENALAIHSEDESGRWEKIAEKVPGKTSEEIKLHFELLVEDINGIESGLVPLPCYVSSPEGSADYSDDGGAGRKGGHRYSEKGSKAEQERRKGMAWTEDEHRLFLLGLEKYGKGDWRSISRNFVISRTPTQVASHAQKYFIRLNSMSKDRRRSSIHDITSVGNGDFSSPQGPITGQTSGSTVASVKLSKPSPSQPPASVGISVYGTPTIGQPFGGPLVSAVGTPVSIPLPPHMVYGVNGPATGAMVTGSPMSAAPLAYPMPHVPRHG